MSLSSTALVVRATPSHDDSLSMKTEATEAPKPGPHQALVKVAVAAQNPTDVQSLDGKAVADGGILGCDFAGTVVQVGSEVTKLKVGDIVAGLIWGGEIAGQGAYSGYTLVDEKISFKVPETLPLEKAATFPLAATTAWLALFSRDCLAIPRGSGTSTDVLVWGASSSVGRFAVQIAALQGFRIIATCSPKHFDAVRKMGATHVFDYKSNDIVAQVQNVAPRLKYAFDTIGNATSSVLAAQAVASNNGSLCTVRPGKANTENVDPNVKISDVLVWTAFLKEHRYGNYYWPPKEDDHKLCTEFFEKLPGWIQSGALQPSVVQLKKGLSSVFEGFQEYRDGKISGYKIVYQIE